MFNKILSVIFCLGLLSSTSSVAYDIGEPCEAVRRILGSEGPNSGVPAGFDPQAYLSLNADLQNAWAGKHDAMSLARNHYVYHGKAEGRVYLKNPTGFDALKYIGKNVDLNQAAQSMSVSDKISWAQNHYVMHGRAEGRLYLDTPAGFNPLNYLSGYNDLVQGSLRMTTAGKIAWAQNHYVNHGVHEGRVYLHHPARFDPLMYLNRHADLHSGTQSFNSAQKILWAQQHYVNHGAAEGRHYYINAHAPALIDMNNLAQAGYLGNDPKLSVGMVISQNSSSGTATLVDDRLLVSAAHVFESIFELELVPKIRAGALPANGPVRIDLSNYDVVWKTEGHGSIKAVSMVVDASYVHGMSENRNGLLYPHQVSRDIVFLELEGSSSLTNIPTIPLMPTHDQKVGQMAASHGYGSARNISNLQSETKDHIVLKLDLRGYLFDWDNITLSARDNIPHGDRYEARREVQALLGQPELDVYDNFTREFLLALPGDSGGPLLVMTPGGVRVAGITSVSSRQEQYNGYASLVAGHTVNGLHLNSNVVNLLQTIKQAMFPLLPAGFDPIQYLNMHPDLLAGAPSGLAEKKAWAQQHYANHGKDEKRLFLALPTGFDSFTYLSQNRDLFNGAAAMSDADKVIWAQQHYFNHGKKEKRLFLAVPAGFDSLTYLHRHRDLFNGTLGLTTADKVVWAQQHYMNHGRIEGRMFH
jgi:hypothetical protein